VALLGLPKGRNSWLKRETIIDEAARENNNSRATRQTTTPMD
jgi:hypothetical protein